VKSVIYKYPIEENYPVGVYLPTGAKVINCEIQHMTICVWVIQNPDALIDTYDGKPDVFILGTGWEIDNNILYGYNYLKTFHVDSFVWHVFVRKGC